ncbi:MAG: GNAT family N-acetyltransferase [Candidatus Latescibacteria bacterium]|nr:GNAT family N-acetyltransferase [Candidatus Latescibacterota bacterium]
MPTDQVVELTAENRQNLRGLFAGYIGLRVILDAILEGRLGDATADSTADPQVACLAIGPFTFVAGDAGHPVAQSLLDRLAGFRAVLVVNGAWREKVLAWRETKAEVAQRHAFSHTQLDPTHLQALASRPLDGIELRAIDAELAQRLGAEVNPDLIPNVVFPTLADFCQRGFGFCALANGLIVGGVTSAILSERAAEIQINTNVSHQKRGIATALGASFALECLERGLEPHWDTGSQISYRLATKLGYRPLGSYEVLECAE